MKFFSIMLLFSLLALVVYGPSVSKNRIPSKEDLSITLKAIENLKKTMGNLNLDKNEQNMNQSQNNPLQIEESTVETYEELGVNMKDLVEIKAPVLDKMMSLMNKNTGAYSKTGEYSSSEQLAASELLASIERVDLYMYYLNFSKKNMEYGSYYLIAGISIFIFSTIFNFAGFYPFAFILGKIGFFIGRSSITAVSLAAIFFFMIFNRNLWIDAGINIFLGPIEILVGSMFALKSFDPNFPIFNRLIYSLILPFVSAGFLILI